MPLFELPADEAMQVRKLNRYAGWGDRSEANRIEPVTMPSFAVPFKFRPGESIFTIGSCFARNVETELMRRGFSLPMRNLFSTPEFSHLDVGIINNYGTPSIYNEIAWAFGTEPFNHDDHIVEAAPGKFVDLHLSPTMRPEARDAVIARRDAVLHATRHARDCRVVIMTLGLIECWYDTHTGYYLNVAPRPSLMKAEPDRYTFRVLSYAETYGFLERALKLLSEHVGDELRAVLTVSPVPLTVTHRDMDVVLANTYSKSVLRAAAEEAVMAFPFVSYYPSYESIITTDRKIAFRDDLRHVSDEMVRLNVGRMVEAFTGEDRSIEDIVAELADSGEPAAVERARAYRDRGGPTAEAFFARTGDWTAQSVLFAIEHAGHLLATGKAAEATEALTPHLEANRRNFALVTVLARAMIEIGEADAAITLIDEVATEGTRATTLWDTLLDAAVASKREGAVRSALSRLSRNGRTNNRPTSYLKVARFFRDLNAREDAEAFFKQAWSDGLGTSAAAFEFVEALVDWHRSDEAKALLMSIPLNTDWNRKRYAKIAQNFGIS